MLKKVYPKTLFKRNSTHKDIYEVTDSGMGAHFERIAGLDEFETDLGNGLEMQLVGVYPEKLIFQQVKGVVTVIVHNTEGAMH